MNVLRAIIHDPTFLAHGVGILGVIGTALAGVSPLFGGIIAGLTAVFHVAQTFGNGTAVPPGWVKPAVKPDRSSPTSFDGAGFIQPHVDGPAPKVEPLAAPPLHNAAGTTPVEP